MLDHEVNEAWKTDRLYEMLNMSDSQRQAADALIRDSLTKSKDLSKDDRVDNVRKETMKYLESEGLAAPVHSLGRIFESMRGGIPAKYAVHPFITAITQESFPSLLGK